MAWIDHYREASFRNIKFYVPVHEGSGGRRNAVHEFPNQDIPYVQDMGGRAKKFTIEARIYEPNYMTTRDDLIEALDKGGSGKLVHPYLGTLYVSCNNYSFSERAEDGGMVVFSIEFIQSGELTFPKSVLDTVADVASKKLTALEKAKAALAAAYDIINQPHSIAQNAIDTINNGLSLIEDSKRVVGAAASFKADIETVKGKVLQLAYDVISLGQDIADLVTFGTNITDDYPADSDNARRQFDEMKLVWDFEPEESFTAVDPGIVFSQFLQFNAIINALGLLSIMEFDSYDEAIAAREEVFIKLEKVIVNITHDEFYISIVDLQTAVSKDIETRGATLARLSNHFLPVSLPAIVVSYDLYGNIDKESDIINRNKVGNPNFVPGGRDIEVLVYV